MVHHRVFLGAPTCRSSKVSKAETKKPTVNRWRVITASAEDFTVGHRDGQYNVDYPSSTYPSQAALEAAGRRISMLYENVIFDQVEDTDWHLTIDEVSENAPDHTQGHTTMITWPPSAAHSVTDTHAVDGREFTFLRPTGSLSRSRFRSQEQTQETNSFSFSVEQSSGASVARFPTFHFSLHTLSSLSSVQEKGPQCQSVVAPYPQPHGSKQKINILVATLEVEGPETIRIKKGPEAGKEVTLLKIIVGDEEGRVAKLTAWREVADRWCGSYPDESAMKRGDIVYLHNILVSSDKANQSVQTALSLTASPTVNSSMLICYRTMPRARDDEVAINDDRYRPDLRLGYSDAAVRKVASLVRWFETMVGISS